MSAWLQQFGFALSFSQATLHSFWYPLDADPTHTAIEEASS